jgi:hypothetical protein
MPMASFGGHGTPPREVGELNAPASGAGPLER